MKTFGRTIINRFIAVVMVTAVLFCVYPSSFDEAAAETGAALSGQVVVLYEDDQIAVQPGKNTKSRQQDPVETAQEKILDEALDDSYTIDDTIVLDAAGETDEDMVLGVISSEDLSTEELVDALQNTEGIRYAEPNFRFKASTLPDWNDNFIEDSWQLGESGINADMAPDSTGAEDPVVLAVMDSGIAYDHPDLVSSMWSAPADLDIGGEHGIDYPGQDDDPYDEDGHGTHCAGIIAAAANNSEGIAGVMGERNVQLMSVRVLDETGEGDFSEIIKAFDYLIEAKKKGVNIKAVNCSFGVEGRSSILDSVIDRAGGSGILTIAAAGNDALDNDVKSYIPANCNSRYVISVAATDEDGSLASYSNYGKNNVDVAAPGSNILSSVSYTNFAPYLYSAERISDTTQVYGEFDGAEVEYDAETGSKTITPVTGTGYDGAPVTGVDSFGAAKMYSVLSDGSSGYADLSITKGTESGSFQIGNNQKSLRWSIKNASYGDKYILYFPYNKVSELPYVSMVLRTCSNAPANTDGDLLLGDVIIEEDDAGEISYHTSAEETKWMLNTDKTYNSIWHASGEWAVLYNSDAVSGLPYGSYGLGLVYQAWDDGDFYVDISSLAISSDYADASTFGSYDVYSGTSMATPVVTGSVGLIAAARPGLSADDLKAVLLNTTRKSGALTAKCLTGAKVDFSAYDSSFTPSSGGGSTPVIIDEAKSFIWSGKNLASKVSVLIHNALSGSKTPKKFSVKKKNGKAVLKWKKVKGVSGYIIFRRTGSGRFEQIAKLSSSKKSYTDKKTKKGKKYQYIIVSYKKVSGRSAVRISPASKVKKFKK